MSKSDEQVDLVSEYQDAVRHVALAASMLREIDLERLIRAIDHADAVGPILDPTLYRDKAQAMREDRALLAAALAFVRTSRRPDSFAQKLKGEVDV